MPSAAVAKKERISHINRRLRRQVGRAIHDYAMIEPGDRVMVCLSGGKDSFTMLDILCQLRANAPINFELIAVNLDQKQPGFPTGLLPDYLDTIGIPYHIIEEDTYSIVRQVIPEGKTTCSLCSRLRRGILYSFAYQQGVTKIALGHHRDDIVQTLLLNLFYNGRLKSMPPKLLSDDQRNVVIRPLAYCSEADIAAYARQRRFPIIPCNLCGFQDNLQRQAVKRLLSKWEKQHPGRVESIFRAIRNVIPSHLADISLFDFASLKRGNVAPCDHALNLVDKSSDSLPGQ